MRAHLTKEEMLTKLKISCPFTIGTVLTGPCWSSTPLIMQSDGFYSVQRPSQHCFLNYFFEENDFHIIPYRTYEGTRSVSIVWCPISLSHVCPMCVSHVRVPCPCPCTFLCLFPSSCCIYWCGYGTDRDTDMGHWHGTGTWDTDTGQGHGTRT